MISFFSPDIPCTHSLFLLSPISYFSLLTLISSLSLFRISRFRHYLSLSLPNSSFPNSPLSLSSSFLFPIPFSRSYCLTIFVVILSFFIALPSFSFLLAKFYSRFSIYSRILSPLFYFLHLPISLSPYLPRFRSFPNFFCLFIYLPISLPLLYHSFSLFLSFLYSLDFLNYLF